MRSTSKPTAADNNNESKPKEHAQDEDRVRTAQENVGGIPGTESHGGDVAPPNADDAGRRQSPESGPPDRH